ncbi:MAG: hypothetical protein Q7R41_00325 [Phycisphaerales bacterium]|nr:hypothetical protein [Phycisphaerales bacterium]
MVLAGVCAGVEFVLIWFWLRRRSAVTAWGVWIGAAVSVALVAMSLAVVTPSERIAEVCRELGRAVDDGDMDAVSARIASDFSAEELDREELLRRATIALTRVRVDQVRLHRLEIEVLDEQRAAATFDASCNVRTVEGFAGALPSRWKLAFRRERERWVVTRIESIPTPPLQIKRVEDWLR